MKIQTRFLQLVCPLVAAFALAGCDTPKDEPAAVAQQPNAAEQGAQAGANAQLDPERLNKVCLPSELEGSCVDSCGEKSKDGCCYCDDMCEEYDDCCDDYAKECVDNAPERCGGIEGLTCSNSEDFCMFEEAEQCGRADQLGACTERPEECPKERDPVCGCDGRDYRNECEAHRAGTSVEHEGRCRETACGGREGDTCGRDEFCDFERSAQCGRGDRTGVCEDRPDACSQEVNPVCGCDGRTYGNECKANLAGVGVLHDGACQAAKDEQCGGILDVPCSSGQFCHFCIKDQCGRNGEYGLCIDQPDRCSNLHEPVCGCDGKTYGNECKAGMQGVSILHFGHCN